MQGQTSRRVWVRALKVSIGRRTSRPSAVPLPPGWPATFGPLELALVDTPTPFLALDMRGIRVAYERLVTAFNDQVEVCYAVKCNADPVVLEALARAGANFEIASAAELAPVVAVGGDARQVLYSNTVKPAAHITATYQAGVRLFAADSAAEIKKIAKSAPGAGVVVRVSVDDTHSRFPLSSKFGAPLEEALPLLLLAVDKGLTPSGITFHVGSQCTDQAAWAKAVNALGPILTELRRN